MTDRELLYIKTIAETQSFSKAAKLLYMTQPSLSKCVANLERELGTALFLRSKQGIALTYAGERYCHAANQILNIYYDMSQELHEIEELKRGRIRMGISTFLSSWFLPQFLPEFCEKYPGIEISLLEKQSEELKSALFSRQIDFAILLVFDSWRTEESPSFEFFPLRSDPYIIVLPKNSGLTQYSTSSNSSTGLRELDPKYLKDQRFILGLPQQRLRRMQDMILRGAGIVPCRSVTTRNYDTARRLACNGMGVTILPWQAILTFAKQDDADYYAIPAHYRAECSPCVVTVKDSYISKACLAFIELCKTRSVQLDSSEQPLRQTD